MSKAETQRKLAEIIHNSWSLDPFDPDRDSEDWTAADAVIAAFPQVLWDQVAAVARVKVEAAAIADALGERGLVDFADDVRMLAKL